MTQMGNNKTLHVNNTTVMGNSNEVTGNNNTIMGNDNIIKGDNNRIMGNNNDMYGVGNSDMGNDNSANNSHCGSLSEKLKPSTTPPRPKFLQTARGSVINNMTFGQRGMSISSMMGDFLSNISIDLGDHKSIKLRNIRPKGSLQTTHNSLGYGDYEIRFGKAFYQGKDSGLDLAEIGTMEWDAFLARVKKASLEIRLLKGQDTATDDNEKECKLCMENERVCLMIPCGHKYSCISCANRLISEANSKESGLKCSICNGKGDVFVRVFE